MKTPVLELDHLSVDFEGQTALDKVNICVYPGEVHAIIGCNGAGKSVLVKAVAGVLRYSSGQLRLNGKEVSFASVEEAVKQGVCICTQELTVFDNLSIADNLFVNNPIVYKGGFLLNLGEIRRKTQEILDLLHLDAYPRQKVWELSQAEKYLLQFARSLIYQSKVLILDEISASLTNREMEVVYQLIQKCKAQGMAIIYISHSLGEITRIADRVTILKDGAVAAQMESGKLGRDELTRLMLGEPKREYYPKLPVSQGNTLLRVRNLFNHFLHDINLDLHEGEVIGIAGIAGSGRTQLLKALAGLEKISQGEIVYSSRAKGTRGNKAPIHVGYIPEDRDKYALFPDFTPVKNITVRNLDGCSTGKIMNLQQEEIQGKVMMERLGIKTGANEDDIASISSGNKQKIVVSQCLYSNCSVYLFDEPTQGVDIAGKVEIYNIINGLIRNGAGVIMVSSDFSELTGMCDKIFILKEGTFVAELSTKELDRLNLIEYFI